MKVHILERIVFFVIVCIIFFVGLCLYTLLVSIYQSHLPHVLASHLGDGTRPTASCGISHARWTPFESSQQLEYGRSSHFQSHASCVLPAGASGDPETSRLLLSLLDRHVFDIVYFDQPTSTSAAAAAAVIEVKVEEFHGSEEALRAETRAICVLRPSQGRYGIGVFAAFSGHEYSARDNITLQIPVWLPGPRGAEAHVPPSQRVIGDSPPLAHANAFGGQLSTPLMNAPIEMDTAQINTPHRYVRGKCNDVPLSLEPAVAAGPNIPAAIPTAYINNSGSPSGIMLATTDDQIAGRIYPAGGKCDGFFRVSIHSLNDNPLDMRHQWTLVV